MVWPKRASGTSPNTSTFCIIFLYIFELCLLLHNTYIYTYSLETICEIYENRWTIIAIVTQSNKSQTAASVLADGEVPCLDSQRAHLSSH